MSPEPKRSAVALSGGVDSSAAAALLKEQGHDVIGLTLLLRAEDDPQDAQRVADELSIPLHVFDRRDRFAACVVEPFAQSYLHGETPNPCVLCNRRMKFGDLMEEAKKLGATALATGHYARRVETAEGAQLHRGADEGRDQSYFLFALTQEQIDFLRFPLAEMSKEEVRAFAAKHQLPVANKPDSQDICFVPNGDYVSVLQKLHPEAIKGGDIVDQSGAVLGQHQGIVHFTIGQRRGLHIGNRTGDHNEPLFVLELDAEKRRVVVGPREALARREVFLRDVNWLATEIPPDLLAKEGIEVTVRLRSTQQPVPARFYLGPAHKILRHAREGGHPICSKESQSIEVEETPLTALIVLHEATYGVSPGQAAVITQGSRVLGGGWITGAA